MRVLQAKTKRPLDLLAIGAGGHVAAASSAFGVRGDVEVWKIATGQLAYVHTNRIGTASCVAFDLGGGHLLVGADTGSTITELTSHNELPCPQLALEFAQFAFAPDGSQILVTAINSFKCFAIDMHMTFRELWAVKPFRCNFDHPVFSPSGEWVAVSKHDASNDRVRNHVLLHDAATGKLLVEIPFDPTGADPILQISFSADSTKVIGRSSGRTVKVFDATTGQSAGELLHPGRPYVTGMAVHPNGTVACSRTNGTVCLWNLEKCELIRTLDWKLGKLVSVKFSPDGTIGAAGTEDGQVIVWDVDL
ncbi:MAG: hypothetical protein K8U57_18155 [Planctomycetes bacterium]|nr:hypothetical protein [Planctomycetota bacterium]